MAEVTLAIEGMSCNHCVNRVSKALAAVPGVQVKSVSVGRAVVEADNADNADNAGSVEQALIDAVDKAGYPAHAER
jgi:copper chaperone CopZ